MMTALEYIYIHTYIHTYIYIYIYHLGLVREHRSLKLGYNQTNSDLFRT